MTQLSLLCVVNVSQACPASQGPAVSSCEHVLLYLAMERCVSGEEAGSEVPEARSGWRSLPVTRGESHKQRVQLSPMQKVSSVRKILIDAVSMILRTSHIFFSFLIGIT